MVRFSILIPAYNREKYVGETLDSVFSQTFTDYEVIVTDDGSTDQTVQVLESYGTRIKVIRQPKQGTEAARNAAAAQACGEYPVMLDSDDLLLPCALATYDRIIRTLDSPPLIIGSIKTFRDGQPIPSRPTGIEPDRGSKFSRLYVEGSANPPFQQPICHPEVEIRRDGWLWAHRLLSLSRRRRRFSAKSRDFRTVHYRPQAVHHCVSRMGDALLPQ